MSCFERPSPNSSNVEQLLSCWLKLYFAYLLPTCMVGYILPTCMVYFLQNTPVQEKLSVRKLASLKDSNVQNIRQFAVVELLRPGRNGWSGLLGALGSMYKAWQQLELVGNQDSIANSLSIQPLTKYSAKAEIFPAGGFFRMWFSTRPQYEFFSWKTLSHETPFPATVKLGEVVKLKKPGLFTKGWPNVYHQSNETIQAMFNPAF